MIYDAIVVGAGIEGSSAAYQLAKKGKKNVLLLEQVSCIVDLCLSVRDWICDFLFSV